MMKKGDIIIALVDIWIGNWKIMDEKGELGLDKAEYSASNFTQMILNHIIRGNIKITVKQLSDMIRIGAYPRIRFHNRTLRDYLEEKLERMPKEAIIDGNKEVNIIKDIVFPNITKDDCFNIIKILTKEQLCVIYDLESRF